MYLKIVINKIVIDFFYQRSTDQIYLAFLHLHEIVEGLYFHYSLSVCLSVCVCVCVRPDILVNEIPAEQMHQFGRGFR